MVVNVKHIVEHGISAIYSLRVLKQFSQSEIVNKFKMKRKWFQTAKPGCCYCRELVVLKYSLYMKIIAKDRYTTASENFM